MVKVVKTHIDSNLQYYIYTIATQENHEKGKEVCNSMLELNWPQIHNELTKIIHFPDQAERDLRHRLVTSIIEKVHEYNDHVSEYEYHQKLQAIADRGVVFIPLSNAARIKAAWSRLFASSVSAADKKEIYYNSYRWHIFSYNKVDAQTRSKAKQSFEQCEKEKVYIFYQNREDAFYIENAHLLKAEDFDTEQDIYIFDMVKRWTYVHTHEEVQCGPYFYQSDN